MQTKENYFICFVVFICSLLTAIFIAWFMWSDDTNILIENISITKRYVIAIISLIVFGFNLCLFIIAFKAIWNEKFLVED